MEEFLDSFATLWGQFGHMVGTVLGRVWDMFGTFWGLNRSFKGLYRIFKGLYRPSKRLNRSVSFLKVCFLSISLFVSNSLILKVSF